MARTDLRARIRLSAAGARPYRSRRRRPQSFGILIHGGGWFTGHPKITNPVLEGMEISATLIRAGYAVARPAYRLSGEAIFPAQLHDCKSAIRYLRAHADTLGIDSRRFAAMGESAGGHLACMLGFDGPGRHVGGQRRPGWAVECSAGSHQLVWPNRSAHDGSAKSRQCNSSTRQPLFSRSAIDRRTSSRKPRVCASGITTLSCSPGCPPFLIQHGDQDRLVPIGQARSLAQALENHGVTVQFTEIAGGDHCFWGADTASIMPEVYSVP